TLLVVLFGLLGRKRSLLGADSQDLERLAEIELAILLIGVQAVELLDGLVGAQIVSRKLVGELVDDLARALPMENVCCDVELIELRRAHAHRIGVTDYVAVLGRTVQCVPEVSVMRDVARRKRQREACEKPQHDAGDKLFHCATPFPCRSRTFLAEIRSASKSG